MLLFLNMSEVESTSQPTLTTGAQPFSNVQRNIGSPLWPHTNFLRLSCQFR